MYIIILHFYANMYNIIHICLVYNVILTLIKQYKPIIVHKIIKNQILFLSGFCRELGIGIVAYSPLGRGFFTTGPKLKLYRMMMFERFVDLSTTQMMSFKLTVLQMHLE